MLYPNLTYTRTAINSTYNDSHAAYGGVEIGSTNAVVIGPWAVNETFSILSLTVSMINNTSASDYLGYLTVLVDARMLYDIVDSPEGLETTGQVLLIGPTTSSNRFAENTTIGDPGSVNSQPVRFLLPPQSNKTLDDRHNLRALPDGNPGLPFNAGQYPAVADAFTKNNKAINNAGSMIKTHNEENIEVSAGYATLSTTLVNWALVFEQSHREVVAPITHLRNVLVACKLSIRTPEIVL